MAHGVPQPRHQETARKHPLQSLLLQCEKQLLILQASIQGAQINLRKDLHLWRESQIADSDTIDAHTSIEPLERGTDTHRQDRASTDLQLSKKAAVSQRRGPCSTGIERGPERSSTRGKAAFRGHGEKFSSFLELPLANIRFPEVPFSDLQVSSKPLVEKLKHSALSLVRPFSPAVLREPEVKLSQWEPLQGDTVAVLVKVAEPRGFLEQVQVAVRKKIPALGPLVKVTCEKQDVPVFPRGVDGSWRALIPTTPLDKPGTRDLQVLVRDGRHAPYDRVIYLKNRDYIIESLQLPERKKSLIGGATDKELAAMSSLRALLSPQQLWKGPFLQPSEGAVTTYYGVQRYYNGRFAEGYYHRGVDYGAETGSPVHSPADGKVVLIGHEDDGFRLHGNCLGLDHGQGVVSTMLHLDSIQVKEGEVVKAGQVLGTVGETGIATGPHLHWGLYVNGECIDPESWMKEQFWL